MSRLLAEGRILGVLCNLLIYTTLERLQGVSHSGVERYHGRGAVDAAARGTELEAVTRKGKRRRAVAVGIVDNEVGNLRNVNGHTLLALQRQQLAGVGLFYVVEQFRQLRAEERRDDGRRCLVATQTMGVRGTHNRSLQQSVMAIDGHERLDDKRYEAQRLVGSGLRLGGIRLAWSVQQHAVVG